ncbi:MAG: (2Fe-2S)-binding protein [Proteobacteria bacterium]|nr:(2Fe-2S)-binding protein [Pseudomonadota bacterium]
MPDVKLTINGQVHRVNVTEDEILLWAIREHLRLTGTKYGCGTGLCGACTVLADGKAIRACTETVGNNKDKQITTIEGIAEDHPLKRAWMEVGMDQCAYCQPGQIMQAAGFLRTVDNPDEEEIVAAMSAILCRCGTYPRIKKAVHLAAKLLRETPADKR